MMKKLLLITEVFPFGSGEISFISPELPKLAERFEVTVAASNVSSSTQTAEMPEGVRALNFRRTLWKILCGFVCGVISQEVWRESKGKSAAVFIQTLRWFVAAYCFERGYRKYVKNNGEPDVIYSYWHTAPLYGVLRAGVSKKTLVVTRAHGYDLFAERTDTGFMPFKRKIDAQIDRVILACGAAKDYYIENYSVSEPAKCEVSYLGADNELIAPYSPSETLRLVSCSYLVPVKRVSLLIEALSAVTCCRVKWVHIGGGMLEHELRKLAHEQLDGKVDWEITGSVDNTAVRERLMSEPFDFFVSVSESEGGVPISIVEAASFAIPIAAADAGGIREIAGDAGVLFPRDSSAEEIAGVFSRLAQMPQEQREKMRRAAYNKWKSEFVASDNAERFADRLLELSGQK